MPIHEVMQCTFRHTVVLEEIFFDLLETKLKVHADTLSGWSTYSVASGSSTSLSSVRIGCVPGTGTLSESPGH